MLLKWGGGIGYQPGVKIGGPISDPVLNTVSIRDTEPISILIAGEDGRGRQQLRPAGQGVPQGAQGEWLRGDYEGGEGEGMGMKTSIVDLWVSIFIRMLRALQERILKGSCNVGETPNYQ